MQTRYFVLCIFILFSFGCAHTTPPLRSQAPLPYTGPVDGQLQAAAGANGKFDVSRSPYFASIDYYGPSPTQTLLRLEGFRTYQQSSEVSCGPASALMVLAWFGMTDVTEDALAKEMDIRFPDNPRADGSFGSDTTAMVRAFAQRGYTVTSSLDTANKDGQSFASEHDFALFVQEHLRAGVPIMVENGIWGGHWMVVIGYDSMGTKAYADDVLILADPYDTVDHCQDGLTIYPMQRFFYEWRDFGVLPEGQRVQQYLVARKQ